MNKKPYVATAIVALAAALFIGGCRGREAANTLELSGNVEVTEIDLGFKQPGRVTNLYFREGDKVHKGDKIASLDGKELEKEVERAKAFLLEAKEKENEVDKGSRPQEIKEAEAEESLATAELEKAEKDYERAGMLFKNGAVSAAQYESAKKSYDSASARRRGALERLSLVKEGPRKEERLASAYRVEQARAALDGALERLKDAAIYAPSDGVVLKKNTEEGETVSPGAAVCTIADPKDAWVKVYLKEDRLGVIKLGDDAEVTVDSYPGKAFKGKVTYISSQAEFTPKNVQTREERVKLVFGVKVSVENMNDELKPGMPADVKIRLR